MKSASEVEIACHPEGGLCVSCTDSLVSYVYIYIILNRYDGFLDNVGSILSAFYCKEEKSWKYSKQLLLRCGKPLSLALKVFLRINNNGIICIQHLLNDDAEVQLFIDCFLHPMETVSFLVCWNNLVIGRLFNSRNVLYGVQENVCWRIIRNCFHLTSTSLVFLLFN